MSKREKRIADVRERVRRDVQMARAFVYAVRQAWHEHGGSMGAFAASVGLSRQTVHNILGGQMVPRRSTLQDLCDAYPANKPQHRPEWWIGE